MSYLDREASWVDSLAATRAAVHASAPFSTLDWPWWNPRPLLCPVGQRRRSGMGPPPARKSYI